ncbi:type III-D CRISPR-associated protein Csx19 [Bacillus ndiopicus]|uniref:type III-D CRISPR-associated protein Csx19 n=1 Tax=Bacillus ndiopicus TaxID=1347368 RepID=UPI0005A93377|nr:CRISPR-associated protein Csx19 [Bacillus ndiopicus]
MKAIETSSLVITGTIDKEQIMDCIKEHNGFELYIVTDYGVLLGKVTKEHLILNENEPNPEFIQEVRIFNEKEEIKITRQEERFVWRKRKDMVKDAPKIHFIDECHKLWGKVVDVKGAFSILHEKRGTKIAIPHKYEIGDEVSLVFRKYIAFQDKDFATDQPFSYSVVDERLVKYGKFLKEGKDER